MSWSDCFLIHLPMWFRSEKVDSVVENFELKVSSPPLSVIYNIVQFLWQNWNFLYTKSKKKILKIILKIFGVCGIKCSDFWRHFCETIEFEELGEWPIQRKLNREDSAVSISEIMKGSGWWWGRWWWSWWWKRVCWNGLWCEDVVLSYCGVSVSVSSLLSNQKPTMYDDNCPQLTFCQVTFITRLFSELIYKHFRFWKCRIIWGN